METLDRKLEDVPVSPGGEDDSAAPNSRPGDVLVAIPAYNEERFIGSVVVQVRLHGYSVLVVDDGSTDRTAAVAAAAGAVVERHERNLGKTEAINTAFQSARSRGATALVVMDGDSQHSAAEISGLLALIYADQADIVIGSRFLTTSGGRIPSIRSMGQRGMTLATNLASGTSVTDSQSGFRAFSRRAIEALLFSARGFNVEGEMQFQARDHGLRVVELPITARYDDPPKRNVVGHGVHILDGILRLAVRHRPLIFFGGPGSALLLGGLGIGAMVMDIYQRTNILAVGYSLLAVLCTVVGLLGVFTGIMLHAVRGTFLDLDRRLIALGSSLGRQYLKREQLSGPDDRLLSWSGGGAFRNRDAK